MGGSPGRVPTPAPAENGTRACIAQCGRRGLGEGSGWGGRVASGGASHGREGSQGEVTRDAGLCRADLLRSDQKPYSVLPICFRCLLKAGNRTGSRGRKPLI